MNIYKFINYMNSNIYPHSQSQRTFTFGKIVIDSNFENGNCSYA
jgi:hypothetical protein